MIRIALCALVALLAGCGESTPEVGVQTSVPQSPRPAEGTRVTLIEPSTELHDMVYLRNRAEQAAYDFLDAWGYQSVRQWAPSKTYTEDPQPYDALEPMVRSALQNAGYVIDSDDPQMRVRTDYYFRPYEYVIPPDTAHVDTGEKRRVLPAMPWQGGRRIDAADPHSTGDGTADGGERVSTRVHALSLTFIRVDGGASYRAGAAKVDPARDITQVAPMLLEHIMDAMRE